MAETLVPNDAEQAVIYHLGAGVSTSIPGEPKPDEFTRVTAGGGAPLTIVSDRHVVTIEAFALTETEALARANAHIASLEAAGRDGQLGGATCYGVRVASLPANLPMPSVPTHRRYVATVSADLRRAAN